MSTIRVGVIGAGRIGRVHAENLAYRLPGVELVTVADPVASAAQDCARTLRLDRWTADYREVLSRVFAPDAYFARVRGLAARLDRAPYLPPFSWRALRRDLTALARALHRFTRSHPDFARPFWSTLWFCLRTNPRALQILLINMVIYLHLGPFSRYVIRQIDEQIDAIDAGRWVEPRPLAAQEAAVRAVA